MTTNDTTNTPADDALAEIASLKEQLKDLAAVRQQYADTAYEAQAKISALKAQIADARQPIAEFEAVLSVQGYQVAGLHTSFNLYESGWVKEWDGKRVHVAIFLLPESEDTP